MKLLLLLPLLLGSPALAQQQNTTREEIIFSEPVSEGQRFERVIKPGKGFGYCNVYESNGITYRYCYGN